MVCFVNTYPLDSNLSGGWWIALSSPNQQHLSSLFPCETCYIWLQDNSLFMYFCQLNEVSAEMLCMINKGNKF